MQQLSSRRWMSLGLGLMLSLVGCEATDGNKDGGTSGDACCAPDSGPAPAGLVTFKQAGETAEADFTSASEYLIVPYSVSDVAASAISFDIKITAGTSAADGGIGSSSFPVRIRRLSLRESNPVLWAKWQQRLTVEAWTRGLAERAARSPVSPVSQNGLSPLHAGAACKKSSECDPNEVCVSSKCESSLTIKTEEFSATKTISAEVKKKGTIAAVLVDSADATVKDTDVSSLLDTFEKIVGPRDVALFGDPELKSGEPTRSSDRNADGLVWLVLTSKVQEKQAVGFFVATDFTDDAKSNKADILYIDSAQPGEAGGIMAHEYEHLLNYGAKVYRAQANGGTGALEALWLDEGQAHMAEDACGYGGENVILLNQEVFTNFSDKSLFETDSSKDTLAMRGMALTYVRYLFEQKGGVTYNADGTITDKGGAAFLKALHTSDKQGTAAITAQAGSFGDFKSVFDHWMAALALDGRGVTEYARYVYQPLVTDPVTGAQIGMKIRGTRKDNKGSDVKLEGFIEDSISEDKSDTTPNATGKFFLLKGKTGKVEVSVTSQDTDIRFALIKVK